MERHQTSNYDWDIPVKMSRTYKLTVEATGISEEQLNKVVRDQFGWEGEADRYNEITFFCGDGSLYGGMDDEEAHNEIYATLKEINPNAKIRTEWTYMEDLPYEYYGDDIN